jgi:hypothetical protein
LEIKRPDLATIIMTDLFLALIKVVLALGLLKGKNWARWSWLSFGLVYFILSYLYSTVIGGTTFLGDIFKLIWIVSIFLLLFKSDSAQYFWSEGNRENK